jgi:hypothetical protein
VPTLYKSIVPFLLLSLVLGLFTSVNVILVRMSGIEWMQKSILFESSFFWKFVFLYFPIFYFVIALAVYLLSESQFIAHLFSTEIQFVTKGVFYSQSLFFILGALLVGTTLYIHTLNGNGSMWTTLISLFGAGIVGRFIPALFVYILWNENKLPSMLEVVCIALIVIISYIPQAYGVFQKFGYLSSG